MTSYHPMSTASYEKNSHHVTEKPTIGVLSAHPDALRANRGVAYKARGPLPWRETALISHQASHAVYAPLRGITGRGSDPPLSNVFEVATQLSEFMVQRLA